MSDPQIEVRHTAFEFQEGCGLTACVWINAGNRGTTRVVPPAGEAFAYDRQEWARRVEVTVSPTGRSVRVFVDGTEVPVP